jgi:glycosyltransferase involved in cell wall biosynthesis
VSDSRRILLFECSAAYFLSQRLPLARAVQDLGHEVHVATSPDAAAENIRTAGFEFHPVELSRGGVSLRQELATLRHIRRLYAYLRPQLVYQLNTRPAIYGTLAARSVHIPAVVSVVSGLGYFAAQSGLRKKLIRQLGFCLYRFALRHPNQKVIFHNGDYREAFVTRKVVRRKDSDVIPGPGVNIEYFAATQEPPGTPRVVFPARMLRDKGVYEYVAAAKLLRAQGIQAHFVLAGDTDRGDPNAIPEAQLRRWRVEGDVEWKGHATDMRALYTASHIVCLPSYHEDIPMALLEAAACGRPVVTTDVTGCRDTIRAGETGYLVPPGDVEKLAAALRCLIQDPGLRRSMGYRARSLAEIRFATRMVVARTLVIMQELMEKGRLIAGGRPA